MSGKSSASFFPHPGPPKARTNQTGDQPKVRVSTQGQAVDDPRPKTPVPAGSDFCPAPLQCRRRRRRPWRPPLAELPEGATRPTVVAGQRPLICQLRGTFLDFFFARNTSPMTHPWDWYIYLIYDTSPMDPSWVPTCSGTPPWKEANAGRPPHFLDDPGLTDVWKSRKGRLELERARRKPRKRLVG